MNSLIDIGIENKLGLKRWHNIFSEMTSH